MKHSMTDSILVTLIMKRQAAWMNLIILFGCAFFAQRASAADFSGLIKNLSNPGTTEYALTVETFLKDKGSGQAVEAIHLGMRSVDSRILKATISLSRRLRLKNNLIFGELARISTDNPDESLRREAFSAAVEYDTSDDAGGLVSRMLKDKSTTMRRLALSAALEHRGRAAIPALKEALKDPDGNVRMKAAQNLAKLGDKSGRFLALDELDHGDWKTQAVAIETLGLLGDPGDIEKIRHIAADPNANSAVINSANYAIKHSSIVGKPFDEQIRIIISNMTDLTADDGVWAEKEAIVMLEIHRKEFIRAVKSLSKEEGAVGRNAALFLHDQDLD